MSTLVMWPFLIQHRTIGHNIESEASKGHVKPICFIWISHCNFKLESAEISIITCLPYGLTNSMEFRSLIENHMGKEGLKKGTRKH
jgi:hypothetical protein